MPRKATAKIVDVDETPKRKPGRPRKVAAEVIEAAPVAETKRKPGRPRKQAEAVVGDPEVPTLPAVSTLFEDPEDYPIEYEEDQESEESDAPARSKSSIDKMADAVSALAESQRADVESRPVKSLPWARFKTKSTFNPTGNKKRALTRRVYQNYSRAFVPNMTDREIELCNLIEPGKYIKNLVTVSEFTVGQNTDLHIVYDNSTPEKALELKNEWRSLGELLERCIKEGPSDGYETRRRGKISRDEEFKQAYAG